MEGIDSPESVFVVSTTHFFWDPRVQEVKLAQGRLLREFLRHFNTGKHPLIMTGTALHSQFIKNAAQ